MRISLEEVDDDIFVDILLTETEIERIIEDKLVTGVCYILNEKVYIGIGLNPNVENENAIGEIEE